MTKELFFKILKEGLKDFPESTLADILYQYKERFDIGLSSGKTESEILDELGDPRDIVNQYRDGHLQNYQVSFTNELKETKVDNYNFDDTIIHDINYSATDSDSDNDNSNKSTYENANKKGNTHNKGNAIILMLIGALVIIMFSPLVLVGVTVIASVAFALVASSFAMSIAGIAVLLAKLGIGIIGLTTVPQFILEFPNSVIILTIIGFILLFLFATFCVYYLIKLTVILIKKFIKFFSRKFQEV